MRETTKYQPKSCSRKDKTNNYVTDYSLKDYYRFYRKNSKYKKFKSKYIPQEEQVSLLVRYPKYSEILKDFFKLVSQKVLEGERIQLPMRLGYLLIYKKKMNFSSLTNNNKLKVDWKTFNETGIKTYFTNDHRDGYFYTFKWDKRGCIFRGRKIYKFVPARDNTRALAKVLLTQKAKDYIES